MPNSLWDGLYRPSVTGPVTGQNPAMRTCPTCNGTGINPVWISKLCPKCHGEKRVPRA